MNIKIVETRGFSSTIDGLIAKRRLLKGDFDYLKRRLAENPEMGVLLAGTGGIRKVRLKSSSKGKSGGFRVCYFYYMVNEIIYFLFIFPKNEQENLMKLRGNNE